MDVEALKAFWAEFQQHTMPKPIYSAEQIQAFGDEFFRLYQLQRQIDEQNKPKEILPANSKELSEFKQQFESFARDFHTQYQHLIHTGATMNLWKFMDLGRDEVKNCAILSWLLRENGDHGLGKQLLLQILALNPEAAEVSRILANEPYAVHAEYCVHGDIAERIDIVVESQNACLFIEAKIDAVEMSNAQGTQLFRYFQKLKLKPQPVEHKKLFFLTRNKQLPIDSNLHDKVISISWKEIACRLKKLNYASDYQQIVLTQLARHFETL